MNGLNFSDATDIRLGSSTITALYYGNQLIWPAQQHDYSQDYLTFEAIDNCTFTWNDPKGNIHMYYSSDNGSTWTEMQSGVATPTINAGQKIILKSNTNQSFYTDEAVFSSVGRFNVMGNIMSLQDGDNFTNSTATAATWMFGTLFLECTTLVNANNLIIPDVTFQGADFYLMFYGCTSLLTAPVLAATTLAGSCYEHMFDGCTSLTIAPELPATTLANYCYRYMFQNCTSLSAITCLATDISATDCTDNWLSNVAASGTFTKNASMSSWTTGASGVPSGWTIVNAQ